MKNKIVMSFNDSRYDFMVDNFVKFYCDPNFDILKNHTIIDLINNHIQITIPNTNNMLIFSSSELAVLKESEIQKIKQNHLNKNITWIYFQKDKNNIVSKTSFENNGFEFHDDYQAMFLTKDKFNLSSDVNLIKEVTNAKDAKIFSKIIEDSFDLSTIDLRKYEGIHQWNEIRKESHMILVKVENEFVGTGNIYSENNYSLIDDISILDTHRNKGYAKQIMKYLIDYGFNQNSKEVLLFATPDGAPLYNKIGFQGLEFFMQVFYLESKKHNDK